MNEASRNVFSMLDESREEIQSDNSKSTSINTDSTLSSKDSSKAKDNVDDAWTIQQSGKTRRLAPQFSLSAKDLGPESPRPKISVSSTNNSSPRAQEPITTSVPYSKRKVLRFSRDELLALRKPSKLMAEMQKFADIISIEALEPMNLKPLSYDDINRMWNIDKNVSNKDKLRPRIKKDDEGFEKIGHTGSKPENEGMWDDADEHGNLAGFDLADMAAAALKFQSETLDLSTLKDSLPQSSVDSYNEDTLPEWASDDPIISVLPSTVKDLDITSEIVGSSVFGAVDLRIEPSLNLNIMDSIGSVASIPTDPHLLRQSGNSVRDIPVHNDIHQWFYLDPSNNIQGPFTSENMRAWFEAGYFSPELPIKLQRWNSFYPLSIVFSSGKPFEQIGVREPFTPIAVQNTPNNSFFNASFLNSFSNDRNPLRSEENIILEMQRAEAERQATINREREKEILRRQMEHNANLELEKKRADFIKAEEIRLAEIEKQKLEQNRLMEEQQRQQLENQRKHQEEVQRRLQEEAILRDNQSQLLEQKRRLQENSRASNNANVAVSPWSVSNSAAENKSKESLREIQMREAAAIEAQRIKDAENKKINGKAGWGLSSTQNTPVISLKEIHQEEELKQSSQPKALQLKSLLGVREPSVIIPGAGLGSSGWSTTPKPQSPISLKEIISQEKQAVVHSSNTPKTSNSWAAKIGTTMSGGSLVSNTTASSVTRNEINKPNTVENQSNNEETFWNFSNQGTDAINNGNSASLPSESAMPSEMRDWCIKELRHFKVNADMTLIDVCYSTDSNVEIREYMSEFLGSTPQVSMFASEFIKRKDAASKANNRRKKK